MADRPLLLSTPMVQAVPDGRKKQTRRVLRLQPSGGEAPNRHDVLYCVGDRLWVKETWQALCKFDHFKPRDIPAGSDILYTADRPDTPWDSRKRPGIFMPRWASRLTLIVTDVRVQRVQEINEDDVEAEGVLTPGAPHGYLINCYGPECPVDDVRSCNKHGCWGVREEFKDLWDSLNAKRGFGWDANPWVVAITFKTHRCNIDRMED